MLRTKCIKVPAEQNDGLRISVMSRHTLSDGITPDPEITADAYDEWWTDLAPIPRLLGDYYKRGLDWDVFSHRYLEHLRNPEVTPRVLELGERALITDVTILCVELTPHECHRRLLAEETAHLVEGVLLDVR